MKKGVKLDIIFTNTPQSLIRAKKTCRNPPLQNAIYSPGDFFAPMSFHVFENKIILINYVEPIFAVVIENAQNANAYKKYIKAVKKLAKPFINKTL